MTNKLITIQEAAELSGKSIQTIRRAIKAKKIKFKKKSTPQGFNYVVEKESVCEAFRIREAGEQMEQINETRQSVQQEATQSVAKDQIAVSGEDLRALTRVLEKMVSQHSEERQSFMRLVNTMQEKVFMLENQINLLHEPKKKWYALWK